MNAGTIPDSIAWRTWTKIKSWHITNRATGRTWCGREVGTDTKLLEWPHAPAGKTCENCYRRER